VVGESLDTARTVVQNAGFQVSVLNEPSTRPAGFVFAQNPNGGSKADKGSTVQLTVSSGPPKPGPVGVPPVIGEPLAQAQQEISKAGLKSRVIPQTSSQPANTVINQSPGAGQNVQSGSTVALTVSSGKITVPDVTGESVSQAKSNLANAGFNNVTTSPQTSSQPSGTVLSQTPAGGSTADPSSTAVNLVVAQAPTIPNVVGLTKDAAISKLQSAGYTNVTSQTETVTSKKKDGVVLSQSPSAGQSTPTNTSVTITVGQFNSPTTTTGTTTTPTTGH
jgi:serine/threonine-protein kinase